MTFPLFILEVGLLLVWAGWTGKPVEKLIVGKA